MKYLIGLGVFFVVIVIAIVLLVTRNPKTKENDQDKSKTTQVTDYATNASKIVYTLQGGVVGDDQRRAFKITIDSDSRTIEQLNGYQNKVAKTQNFSNNIEGYQYFLASLKNANFINERRTRQPDSKGACPLGQTFIFQIFNDKDTVMDRWSSSCGGQGTYGGNTSLTRTLFEEQITNYSNFVSGVSL